jgi:hypothetical protein
MVKFTGDKSIGFFLILFYGGTPQTPKFPYRKGFLLYYKAFRVSWGLVSYCWYTSCHVTCLYHMT